VACQGFCNGESPPYRWMPVAARYPPKLHIARYTRGALCHYHFHFALPLSAVYSMIGLVGLAAVS